MNILPSETLSVESTAGNSQASGKAGKPVAGFLALLTQWGQPSSGTSDLPAAVDLLAEDSTLPAANPGGDPLAGSGEGAPTGQQDSDPLQTVIAPDPASNVLWVQMQMAQPAVAGVPVSAPVDPACAQVVAETPAGASTTASVASMASAALPQEDGQEAVAAAMPLPTATDTAMKGAAMAPQVPWTLPTDKPGELPTKKAHAAAANGTQAGLSAVSGKAQNQQALRQVDLGLPVTLPENTRNAVAMALQAVAQESTGATAHPGPAEKGGFGSGQAGMPMPGLDTGSLANQNAMRLGLSATVPVDAAPETAVASQVAVWVSQNVQSAELKLDALGQDPVEVSISLVGNEARIEFRTDAPEAREILSRAADQLGSMLGSEGIVLLGMSVGGSQPQPGEQAPNPPSGRFSLAGPGQKQGSGSESDAAGGAVISRRSPAGVVDLFV